MTVKKLKNKYNIIIPQEEPNYNMKQDIFAEMERLEREQEWNPTQGEEVWIKVFSNWSKGTYIGYDVTKQTHIVREDEKGGGNLFSSTEVLPYYAMPNESKQEHLTYTESAKKEERIFNSKMMKQKSLEETAEKYSLELISSKTIESHESSWVQSIFLQGAKCQAERMLTDDDLVKLLDFVSKEYNISNGVGWFHSHESIEDVSSKEVLGKWFEQFKKK
jgi:hypothetical protein